MLRNCILHFNQWIITFSNSGGVGLWDIEINKILTAFVNLTH